MSTIGLRIRYRLLFIGLFCAVSAASAGPGAPTQLGRDIRTNRVAKAKSLATGFRADLPIDCRMATDYFTNSIQRKVYRAYKAKQGTAGSTPSDLDPDECVAYRDPQTTMIYVPAAYDGTEPYGVYLHNSPGADGTTPSQPWRDLMDKMKLIYISPNKAGNDVPDWRRIVLALDSLATVKELYKIDSRRVYVGGYSGGGFVGMLCQMYYPDLFYGAISHAAQSYLPGSAVAYSHFSGLSLDDARRPPRRDRKWVVISGTRDKNYEDIVKTSKEWERARFNYRFIDVPGMGHDNAPVQALEEALMWVSSTQATAKAQQSNKPKQPNRSSP